MKHLASFAVNVGGIVFGGFILSKLWSWFVVPTFPSVPTVDHARGIGLLLVMNFIFMPLYANSAREELERKYPENKYVALVTSLSLTLVIYPMCLLMGYIWHLIIG